MVKEYYTTVIILKKAQPGEIPQIQLCVDYHILNGLLPAIVKAHSKAQGVLSVVPLPKNDELCVYSSLDCTSGSYHIAL